MLLLFRTWGSFKANNYVDLHALELVVLVKVVYIIKVTKFQH